MSKYTAEMATGAARKGAEWMDEHCEGWTLLIDTKTLELSDGTSCILAQTAHCVTKGEYDSNVYNSYNRALAYATGEPDPYNREATRFASEHGFLTPAGLDADERDIAWEMLQIAWLEEIRKRSEGVPA